MGFLYERIYEDANCLEIANMLGIPMRHRGGATYIACPEHFENTGKRDTKIDKCTCNEKGYYCFSCGAKGGASKLVSKTLGISMYEATQKVISTLPHPENYLEDRETAPNYKPFPLNEEQITALGLQKRVTINCPTNVANSKSEAKESGQAIFNTMDAGLSEDDFDGYVIGHTCTESLDNLFNTNPEAFRFIVYWKAVEMANKYENILKTHLIDASFGPVMSDEDIYHMENVIKKYKRVCNRVAKKFAPVQKATA